MRKLAKIAVAVMAVAVVAVSAIPMTACHKHVHEWSDWTRTETDHLRTCLTCGEEEYGTHSTEEKCSACSAHFKAIGFGFSQGGDGGHSDFASEANVWFAEQGKKSFFTYDYASDFTNTTASDFSMMTEENLENYDLVILLNDMPNTSQSREAFKKYMDNGGACIVFHAAGFIQWQYTDENGTKYDDPENPPTEWDGWFGNELMRSGVYGFRPRDPEDPTQGYYWNTWNPTSERMKIETYDHPVTSNLNDFELEDDTFWSAPCEWYQWYRDLMNDDEVTVLVSMNPTPEEPAGDNPDKASEIWKDGHHPIVWANNNYNMVYMNWGHNLQDYNNGAEGKTSRTFSSEVQNQITINAMYGTVIGWK